MRRDSITHSIRQTMNRKLQMNNLKGQEREKNIHTVRPEKTEELQPNYIHDQFLFILHCAKSNSTVKNSFFS
jgi:hypothetical protein